MLRIFLFFIYTIAPFSRRVRPAEMPTAFLQICSLFFRSNVAHVDADIYTNRLVSSHTQNGTTGGDWKRGSYPIPADRAVTAKKMCGRNTHTHTHAKNAPKFKTEKIRAHTMYTNNRNRNAITHAIRCAHCLVSRSRAADRQKSTHKKTNTHTHTTLRGRRRRTPA